MYCTKCKTFHVKCFLVTLMSDCKSEKSLFFSSRSNKFWKKYAGKIWLFWFFTKKKNKKQKHLHKSFENLECKSALNFLSFFYFIVARVTDFTQEKSSKNFEKRNHLGSKIKSNFEESAWTNYCMWVFLTLVLVSYSLQFCAN